MKNSNMWPFCDRKFQILKFLFTLETLRQMNFWSFLLSQIQLNILKTIINFYKNTPIPYLREHIIKQVGNTFLILSFCFSIKENTPLLLVNMKRGILRKGIIKSLIYILSRSCSCIYICGV